MCKSEQTGPPRMFHHCGMDIQDPDSEAAQIRLRILKTHLMSIAEADRLYWSEKVHSREDASEYQKRQERLNEIRLEMMTLTPGSIQ